jgi:hypothetical protein
MKEEVTIKREVGYVVLQDAQNAGNSNQGEIGEIIGMKDNNREWKGLRENKWL